MSEPQELEHHEFTDEEHQMMANTFNITKLNLFGMAKRFGSKHDKDDHEQMRKWLDTNMNNVKELLKLAFKFQTLDCPQTHH